MGLRQRKERENLRGQRGARRAPPGAGGPRGTKCAPVALLHPSVARVSAREAAAGAQQPALGVTRGAAVQGLNRALESREGPTTSFSQGSSEALQQQERLGPGPGGVGVSGCRRG